MLTNLNRDNRRRAFQRLAITFGVFVAIVFGLIITFAWMALLTRGLAALMSWIFTR